MTTKPTPSAKNGLPQRLWVLPTLLLSLVAPRSHEIVLEAFGDAQSRTDYALLAGLAEFGPLSQAALARRIGFDRSDMVSLLRDLERRGLADRQRDVRDRRRNSVSITDSGTRRLRELDCDAARAHQRLLTPLSPIERRQLTSILQALLVHHSDFSPPDV